MLFLVLVVLLFPDGLAALAGISLGFQFDYSGRLRHFPREMRRVGLPAEIVSPGLSVVPGVVWCWRASGREGPCCWGTGTGPRPGYHPQAGPGDVRGWWPPGGGRPPARPGGLTWTRDCRAPTPG